MLEPAVATTNIFGLSILLKRLSLCLSVSLAEVALKILPFALLLSCASPAFADSHLLYFEAQAIAGYSSLRDKPIFYSMNPDAEMQKPSVGFDYLHRFSGE